MMRNIFLCLNGPITLGNKQISMINLRILFIGLLVFLCEGLYAQTAEGLSYQAAVRDASGTIAANKSVGMQFSIVKGSSAGPVIYSETQIVNTTAQGIVNTTIGLGNTNNWKAIKWDEGPMFIKVEIDLNGGSSYTSLGTTQLLAVPYAKQASGVTLYDDVGPNTDKMIVSYSPSSTDMGIRMNNGTKDIEYMSGGAVRANVNLNNGNVNTTGKFTRPATGSSNLVPIAFGTISSTGSIINGTGNFSVSRTSSGIYEITITGETYNFTTHVAMVTVINPSGSSEVATSAPGGKLQVIIGTSTGVLNDRYFQFVVYKP